MEGIDWLKKENGRLLADDMGLGKTMQAILAATSLIESGQSKNALIVCPRSLMYNWQEEIKLWAPRFTSLLISNVTSNSEVWRKVYGKSHFYITNYDHIRKLPDCLKEDPPSILIADEAHKLRKSTSIINKNLSKTVMGEKKLSDFIRNNIPDWDCDEDATKYPPVKVAPEWFTDADSLTKNWWNYLCDKYPYTGFLYVNLNDFYWGMPPNFLN